MRSTQRPPFSGYVPLPALPASTEGSTSTPCQGLTGDCDKNWSSCPGKPTAAPVDTSALAAVVTRSASSGVCAADVDDVVAARAAVAHSAQVAERVSKLRLNLPLKDHAKAKEDGKAANAEVMASLHQSMQSKHLCTQHSRQHSQRSRQSVRTQPSRSGPDIQRRSMHSAVSSGRRSVSTSVALSHQDVLEDGVKVKTESHRLRRQISGFGVNSAVCVCSLLTS